MKKIDTIKNGIGLGDLSFGNSREHVREYFGEPDEIITCDEPGYYSVAWHYRSRGFSAHFAEADDFRLGTLVVCDSPPSLHDVCLIGKQKRDVLDFIGAIGIAEAAAEVEYLDLEEDGDGRLCLYAFESNGLNLWFEDNILTEMHLGFVMDNQDHERFPELS